MYYKIEKKTPGNYFIKIMPTQGAYILFHNNTYIRPHKQDAHIKYKNYFALQRIIFIGKMFQLYQTTHSKIHFIDREENNLYISFGIRNTSDIRRITLFTHIQSDVIPVHMALFENIHIGMLMNSLKEGMQYFIVEPDFSREKSIKLKNIFPYARIIHFEDRLFEIINVKNPTHDDPTDIMSQHNLTEVNKQLQWENYRRNLLYMEILNKEDVTSLSINPVFSTLTYLRKKKWNQIGDIGILLKITKEEFIVISTILNNYLNDTNRIHRSEVQIVLSLYKMYNLFCLDTSAIKKQLSSMISDQQLLFEQKHLINKIAHKQKSYLEYTEEDIILRDVYNVLITSTTN